MDPFQAQKQMFKTWEKEMNQAVEKLLREPAFMQSLSKNMQQTLDFEKLIQSQTEPVLKKMGLPSREDFEKLTESLHAAETKNLNLEEEVLAMRAEMQELKKQIQKPAAKKTPARKKSTAKTEQK